MAEIAMGIIDRIFGIFRDRMPEVNQSYTDVLKTRDDLNRRLDLLEQEIQRAQVNGEDKWFLCVRKKEADDG